MGNAMNVIVMKSIPHISNGRFHLFGTRLKWYDNYWNMPQYELLATCNMITDCRLSKRPFNRRVYDDISRPGTA